MDIPEPTSEEQPEAQPEPLLRVLPPESRFLFVDVAAMRAKQLRRGALSRLSRVPPAEVALRDTPHKLERIAMEEVRLGIVAYDLPPPVPPTREPRS